MNDLIAKKMDWKIFFSSCEGETMISLLFFLVFYKWSSSVLFLDPIKLLTAAERKF
jgi:hypothetical protein